MSGASFRLAGSKLTTTLAPELESVASRVGVKAAEMVRQAVGSARSTGATKSSPTDVVTETDLAVERYIRAELLAGVPGSSFVGEEFDSVEGENEIGWIVDPIDGTVNFLYDLPVVSVSIAATVAGAVVAGVVVDVLRGEVFAASVDGPATCDGRPIATSEGTELAMALVGTGFSYEAASRGRQGLLIPNVLTAARDIRCMGSSALNLCWVAGGRLDAFYQSGMEVYDYAAGALIAERAGAEVFWVGDGPAKTMVSGPSPVARALESVLGQIA